MKKRMIAAAMSIFWITQPVFSAYAQGLSVSLEETESFAEKVRSVSENYTTNGQEEKIIDGAEELNSYGILVDYLEDACIDGEKVVYTYNLPNNVESVIAMSELADGSKKIDITEGNLHNELIITENQQLYLDGFEVKTTENVIEPRAGSSTYDVETCPYGSASDYTVYKGVETETNAEIGDYIENVTISGLALTISILAGIYVPVAGVQASIAYGLAQALITSGRDNNPKSTNLSWKIKRYYYKTGNFAVSGTLCVQKMVGEFYPDADYEGDVVNKTYYNCKEYY